MTITDEEAAELLSFYPYSGELHDRLAKAADRWLNP